MKGLKKFIDKYGKHFTEELVWDVILLKWNPKDIEESAQKRVYYNVTEATLGDMVYLVHYYADNRKVKGIKCMLDFIGNVRNNGRAFTEWVYISALMGKKYDLTPYI